jgi:SCY1-like protein 1
MNFLAKTLGSLTGTSIPYTFGDVLRPYDISSNSLWTIYDGVSDKNSMSVTIFEFDLQNPINSKYIPNIKNALKKHRALSLLPGVLTIIEVIESDKNIYLITEHARPLLQVKDEFSTGSNILGIYQIAVGLKFINIEGSSIHGNLRLENIYVTDSSEWKIGGFEFTINYNDNSSDFSLIYSTFAALNSSNKFLIPPEFESSGSECFRNQLNGVKGIKFDSFLFGVLVYQILVKKLPTGSDVARSSNLQGFPLNKLSAPSVGLRITSEQFLNNGQNSYFSTPEINAYSKFSQIALLDIDEKLFVLNALIFGSIPTQFLEVKVLPELRKIFENTSTNENNIQTILLYLLYSIYKESNKNSKSFENFFKPVYFRAFTLADRAVRTILLKILPHVVDHLTKYEVQDKIYPNLVTGFQDTDLTVRTETLLSISYIMDKITDRQLNNDLLRYLAKLQADSDSKLRANTIVCLTRISKKMQQNTRIGVLITAFGKALKDPDYIPRLCAVRGFELSIEYFTPEICCSKVLSSLSPALLDKSHVIREEAEKTFEMYMKKIRDEATNLGFNEEDTHIQQDVNDLDNLLNSLSLEDLGESLLGSMMDKPSGTSIPVTHTNGIHFGTAKLNTLSQDNMEFRDDDGWVFDDEEEEEEAKESQVSFDKPKESKKSTNNAKSALGMSTNRNVSNLSTAATTNPKKTLVLGKKKPTTKLNLSVEPNIDEDDGWGDGW